MSKVLESKYGGNLRALIEEYWPEGIETVLDLGCGDFWWTLGLPGVTKQVGVDIWPPMIEKAASKAQLAPFEVVLRQEDVREHIRLLADRSYDAVLAIDLVEHFEEDEARFLIAQVERVAKKLAVVWTTLGYIYQAGVDPDGAENPYQEHKYGPATDDFPEHNGWEVLVFPDWHGPRGGGIYAYKIIEVKELQNPLDPHLVMPPGV